VVKLFDGPAQAGCLDLTWNGKDGRGRQVGSGVCFTKSRPGTSASSEDGLLK
jgi:hypothetical protein